jgi:hypothetical protein
MWSGSMAPFLLEHKMDLVVSITLLQIRFVGLPPCSLGSILTEPSWLLGNCSPLTCTLKVMCGRVFILSCSQWGMMPLWLTQVTPNIQTYMLKFTLTVTWIFAVTGYVTCTIAPIVLTSIKHSTKFIKTCLTCTNTKQQRYTFGPFSKICRRMWEW